MLTKAITYTDYNGVERTENFMFNFNKAELLKMDLFTVGGLRQMVERIVSTQDIPSLMKLFDEFILKAYGEKSADGKRFIKSEELSKAFSETEAYSTLFMSFFDENGAEEASKFLRAVIPADIMAQVEGAEGNGIPDITQIPASSNLSSSL